jgi:hypothetical protein
VFWNEADRISIALELLGEFSKVPLIGPNTSYIVSCIESLFRSSQNAWCQLSPENMKLIFHVGYIVPSTFLGDIIENWLDRSVDAVICFAEVLSSCQFIWKSSSFSKFEGRILRRLVYDSDDLARRLKKKLSTCDQDLDSIESVLMLERTDMIHADLERKNSLERALRAYLNRCTPVMEHIVQAGDLSDRIWSIIAQFLSQSHDIDMGKWLGKICKSDTEDLNPKASMAIGSILDKDPQVFHRLLPGWMVRTFSRLTRRFAEDERLSETTLKSVEAFSISSSNRG